MNDFLTYLTWIPLILLLAVIIITPVTGLLIGLVETWKMFLYYIGEDNENR
jgi:hypothetical protein